MNREKYPSQERVKEVFDYLPEGKLVRKSNKHQHKKQWKYRQMFLVDGKVCYEHVLIFIYHYGYRPEIVDHINREIKDNRIENLRAADVSLNSRNRTQNKNNCGYRGVYQERWGTFRASIYAGKAYNLGNFKTLAQAVKARKEAEQKLYGRSYA